MTSSRIKSIDLLRGIVMVLMAIDRVRVYSGVPADHRWGLPLLYLVLIVAELLYPACRRYMHYKSSNTEKLWLKYL